MKHRGFMNARWAISIFISIATTTTAMTATSAARCKPFDAASWPPVFAFVASGSLCGVGCRHRLRRRTKTLSIAAAESSPCFIFPLARVNGAAAPTTTSPPSLRTAARTYSPSSDALAPLRLSASAPADDTAMTAETRTEDESGGGDDDGGSKAGCVDEYKFRDKAFLERTKRWVIVVDDEESIRLAVGDYLYDRGYRVTACADADALLEVVCAAPESSSSLSDGELPPVPDAIVSDVRMPGKDGLELLGLIRADDRLARVPVILLTAKSLTGDRVDGYRAGADAYLCKPFDPDELLAIVDNAIRRRHEMTGRGGKLVDLKEDMSNIKAILRRNGRKVVRATDVYLTPAEREVLDLLCRGYSNGEIASERKVNVLGVNRKIQNLYLKTNTKTRTELVRWAIKTGHVPARRF